MIPENRAEDAQRPRWPAAAGLTAGLVAIFFPLLEGRSYHWAVWIWLLFLAGVASVALVVVAEHRRADRRDGALLPWELLRERNNGVALIVQLVAFAAFSGFQLVFVLWMQDGRHYSALRAGVVTVAFSLGALAIAPLVGRLTVRFGRITVVTGTLLGALGALAVLAVSHTAATEIGPWLLVPGLFVIGVGINLVQPPLTTLFLGTVPPRYAGSASGLWTTAQQFGGAIGVATLSSVFFATVDYQTGFTAATLAGIVALAAAAALCFTLPSHNPARN